MHRYADLNRGRNSHLTHLEGNLVVSDRKRGGKTRKTKGDSQFILWVVILVMMSVSGLYIRYQALYVEDSVFRDAYLLINEHFLIKEPLPAPGQPVTEKSSLSMDSAGSFPSAESSAPILFTEPVNVPPSGVPNQTTPPGSTASVGSTTTTASANTSPSGTSRFNQPNHPNQSAVLPAQNMPSGTIPHSQAESVVTPPVAGNGKVPLASPSAGAASGPSLPSVPIKNEVFSYYQPILNSKSTKVGFFVVNQKTDYTPSQLYQALFGNLLVFQSSNPKVKNFFDPQTRLNHAWIENDTLLLDFNSAFENSKYGYMGIEVKIQQILWTFFNFQADSVNKISYISFLINGKRKETVGGDGKTLKPFYSRKDLRSVITL